MLPDISGLIVQYPRPAIIIMALLLTLFITIVNYFFLDKESRREIKANQKKLQAEIKEHQKAGNTDKMMELQKEMFSGMGATFKHSFRPMIITILPVLIFFSFIKNAFAETAIASTWFWWYIGASIVGSTLFRKLFRLP
jgi:uncharacterized membrane protein (DUF106 family)